MDCLLSASIYYPMLLDFTLHQPIHSMLTNLFLPIFLSSYESYFMMIFFEVSLFVQ